MKSQHIAHGVGAFVLFFSVCAFAQTTTDEGAVPYYRSFAERTHGVAVLVGGGATNFTGKNTRNITDSGGMWDARMQMGTRSLIGTEVSYIGSAQGINTLGLDKDAMLYSNGVSGAARLQFSAGMFQPYLLAGAGWRYYNVSTDKNLSDVRDHDNIFEIPLGTGIALRRNGLIVDGRFEFHKTFAEDLVGGTNQSLDNWTAGIKAGVEF